MAQVAHSWERLQHAHSWAALGEEDRGQGSSGEDTDEDYVFDPSSCTQDEAAQCFLDLLLTLLWAGKVSAKTMCLLCWWAGRAGAISVGDWGFRPNAPSGHYQRHLDSKMGKTVKHVAQEKYKLPAPQYQNHDCSRTVHPTLATPPHEALAKEFVDKALLQDLRNSVVTKSWPPSYYAHPVVRGSAEPVLPCCLYLDGVPFQKRDSFLGVFMYNLLTLHRHLVVVLRKSCLCKCGCGGWCSLWPVFDFIRWSMAAAAKGLHPEARHGGQAWGAADGLRRTKAGTPLGVKCCLLHVRADWVECATFGFPTWQSTSPPLICLQAREGQLV